MVETLAVTRNLFALLALSTIPGSVYIYGWSGVAVSLGWGVLGALVGVYGLMKGLKWRNPKMKLGGGIDVSLPKYVLLFALTGAAAFAVESSLAALEKDDPGKRVSLMTGANLVVFLVASGLGFTIKAETD
ncbi:unnamed protein product [Effrenium voratum]|uniref:Uncharacterized protein n=1 Tax=Effrenium voratum TaxID=2562239 RepID=A0AA36IFR6_9DINO|nr:unnamed protein product [Effrenium voratum]CAJ1385931.1 unnamed protein product [Effrenium voratum]